MATWRRSLIVGLSAILAACTSSGGGGASTAPETSPNTSTETTIGSAPTTTQSMATSTTPPAGSAIDLLTFAEGALYVSHTGMDSGNSAAAIQLVDGDSRRVTLATGVEPVVEIVYKLPAATTFDSFGVPDVVRTEGNTSFFGSLTVSGSVEGPDTGFATLAESTLTFGSSGEVDSFAPDTMIPVRWLRIRLEGAVDVGADHDERTRFGFTEIVGHGRQEERPLSSSFSGAWELVSVDRPDARGERLELNQAGAVITGCMDSFEIRGNVNGAVARATVADPSSGRSGAIVFVADDDGTISATVSLDNGRFEARTTVPPPRSTGSLCDAPETLEAVCDAPLYISFEADSAVIMAESAAILSDIFGVLTDRGVQRATIEGHTSTEGTDAYNRDLSKRRASAVAEHLVALGFPSGALTTVGLGESEPLVFPDEDEAARAINRRVEIVCR